MPRDHDAQEQRIAQLLGEEDLSVNGRSIRLFYEYIKENIELPCILTGIEDMGVFSWEERFIFGYGSKAEYEKLRKRQPSYQDTYELIQFEDVDEYGINVKVKRKSDKKNFVLPLSDLEVIDKSSKNYQLIDDFVIWIVNY